MLLSDEDIEAIESAYRSSNCELFSRYGFRKSDFWGTRQTYSPSVAPHLFEPTIEETEIARAILAEASK